MASFGTDAASFNAALDAFVAQTEQDASRFVVKIGLFALESVVRRTPGSDSPGTPVGNPDLWKRKKAPKGYRAGTARNSWRVGIGAEPQPSRAGADPAGASSIGESAKIATAKAGDKIYIANSAPYANRLENGHSTQAPSGMVRLTLASIDRLTQRILAEGQKQ